MTDISLSPHLKSDLLARLAELGRVGNRSGMNASEVQQAAAEVAEFFTQGLSSSAFRWLVEQGFIRHAWEIVPPESCGNGFDQDGLDDAPKWGFFLTGSGLAIGEVVEAHPAVIRLADQAPADRTEAAESPRWDRNRATLYVGSQVVKQFRRPSPNQEIVLSAFEEEGWPCRIDDPLPPKRDVVPKRRLHDTIKWLNRNQVSRLVRFSGDGSGEGVRWELLLPNTLGLPAHTRPKLRSAA